VRKLIVEGSGSVFLTKIVTLLIFVLAFAPASG
jgi:hypothetical protein